MTKKAYARAGVDVDLGNLVKQRIQARVKSTHGPEVLGKIGGFGGLFAPNFSGMREPVLVASVDGVGTKLKIAFAMNRHETVGADLVNHCINDIAVLGARPLFFLDYIGAERLEPAVFDQILAGFTKACREGGCALIGGETAQMPGMYRKGEYDLAGTIVGVVDRAKMIDGSRIKPGDVVLGLPSNGLHTNGYSLARKILLQKMRLKLDAKVDGLKTSLGNELLRTHKNYQPLLAQLPPGAIRGMAHITGGGLVDNLPRVLPKTCDAIIETSSWRVPTIFEILAKNGKVDREEMYQVFNMGIGMAVIVSAHDSKPIAKQLRARAIGRIASGSGVTRLSF
ncbi:MAG: Phosphoribosylformylglycinamidine cyclo-ligase [uncultured Chthoniobacterales bacterium]|uniref:Phosphoribosylformylglycinamidine cyclo-ligase n=1 Tax=uncultured Chthoniobacterales bacterium TaxID=1836801 RepID=A0A6J4IFI4_9BACT|nr:MAG: Phosphoribosylformylglycinamidine cyclo-ligase [uncultured Chthoniobacterales bacterium]